MQQKKPVELIKAPPRHWVGDGFPVRSLLSYNQHGTRISPFLLLDHAAPTEFQPSPRRRGVGEHPHRGFETVTIVYSGEVSHRDSSGGGGTIRPGDVQWMTAGAGLVHDEFHSTDFTRSGGTMEMVQLWVNLPARHKMTRPRYQTLLADSIPVAELPGNAGSLRVIAGEFAGQQGPAETFSPVNVWDVRLDGRDAVTFAVPDGYTMIVVVLEGEVSVNGSEAVREGQALTMSREGESIALASVGTCRCLLLSGEPIDEPLAGYGPFVMNEQHEIRKAIEDFNNGKFGQLLPADEEPA